jgi:outer membrane protein assembly factor BamB
MLKRLLTPLLSIVIIAAVVFGYYQFKAKNTPVSALLSAIPENALLVIETSNASGLWEKFTQTSVIWEELKQHPSIASINQTGNRIDSLFRVDKELKELVSNKKALMAILPTGAETFQNLFAINTPAIWTSAEVKEKIMSFAGAAAKAEVRSFNGIDIHHVFRNTRSDYYWALNNGLLIISPSQLLIEDALMAMANGRNILKSESFKRVQKTTGQNAHANIYLNYRQLGAFTSKFLNKTGDELPFNSITAAGWSGLDASLKSNQIMLNGFVDASADSSHYFSLFGQQMPQEMDALHMLPANTAYFNYFGLSDFKEFNTQYKKWLKKIGSYAVYEELRDELNLLTEGDIEDNCLSWIETELVTLRTEPVSDSLESGKYLILRTNNTEDALIKLRSISTGLKFEPQPFSINTLQAEEMNLANAYGILLGESFSGFNRVAVAAVNNYIVIANSKGSLMRFMAYLANDKTLPKDANFNSFIENVGDRSSLLIYSAIARSPNIYKQYLEKTSVDLLEQYLESVRKFEGFAFQLVNTPGEMLYNNIIFRHNPVYAEEVAALPIPTNNALWRLNLEANAITSPQLVINHNTNTREIVIQDANNTLYLISNTGKPLWKTKVDGKIMGRIHQIDVYKNGKLQLLFNTAKTVYLIDRNGKNVEAFPVKLPKAATAPLALFDYDNDNEYRIMVACADEKLRLFDAKGQAIKGWNNPSTKKSVSIEPQHLRLGNKDFILVCDESGNIYLLDRQGKSRHTVKEKVSASSQNPFFVLKGKDIKATVLLYTDTLGNLISLGFDNKLTKTNLLEDGNHSFLMADVDNDQREEIIIGHSDKILVYNQSGELLCSYPAPGLTDAPEVYNFGNKKTTIGFCAASESQVYLITADCALFNGFPQAGIGPFALGDINKDGILNVVALIEPNVMVVYNVQ